MGVKMIGVFCDAIKNTAEVDPGRYLARFDMSRHVIATETPLDDMALDSEPRDTLQETPLRETKVA